MEVELSRHDENPWFGVLLQRVPSPAAPRRRITPSTFHRAVGVRRAARDEFLLIRSIDSSSTSTCGPFLRGVENGESIVDAAAREMGEETAIVRRRLSSTRRHYPSYGSASAVANVFPLTIRCACAIVDTERSSPCAGSGRQKCWP